MTLLIKILITTIIISFLLWIFNRLINWFIFEYIFRYTPIKIININDCLQYLFLSTMVLSTIGLIFELIYFLWTGKWL